MTTNHLKQVIVDKLINERQGKQQGENEIKALCPFHDEKNPSFSYNTSKETFHCFGCGIKGNSIKLAQKFGIEFPKSTTKTEYEPGDKVHYFHNNLMNNGYLPHWTDRGITKESLLSGKIGHREYDNIVYDVFPYYDHNNNLLGYKSIPQDKKERSKKTFWSKKGLKNPLYGLQFISEYDKTKPLILCEGEKDFWILKQAGYQVLSAPGSYGYKKEYNDLITSFKVIIIFDNDPAGLKGSYSTAEKLKICLIAKWQMLDISEDVNDVNDLYLYDKDKFTDNIEILIKTAIDPNDKSFLELDKVLSQKENFLAIDSIRLNSGLASFQKKRDISTHIFFQLSKQGKWYYTNDLDFYYFRDSDKTLYHIDMENFRLLINKTFGVNSATNEYDFMINNLKADAHIKDNETVIYKVCHYNKAENTLYIFNNDHYIYKITKDLITKEDNGVDGILFLKDNMAEPFNPNLDNHFSDDEKSNLLDLIFNNPSYSNHDNKESITNEEYYILFYMWFYSLFFEEILPTKPILAVIGEKGSAKTSSLKMIKALFFGTKLKELYTLSEKQDDADNYICNNYFWFLDNQDDKPRGKKGWIEDWLATLSTGREVVKRMLYNNWQEVRRIPRGFPAITSRTPHFRRDDIADRLLIIEVERLEHIKPESQIFNDLMAKRNDLWLVILHELKDVLQALSSDHITESIFRMADFSNFVLKIAHHNNKENLIKPIFDKLSKEQSLFTLEEDPIFQALNVWIEQERPQDDLGHSEQTNSGREIGSSELHKELQQIAHKKGIEGFPKASNGFGMKFKNKMSDYKKFYEITVEVRTNRSTFYEISLRQG